MATKQEVRDIAKMAELFTKTIDGYSPEQLVAAMLQMKAEFENQELYLSMFRSMARRLVIKLGA